MLTTNMNLLKNRVTHIRMYVSSIMRNEGQLPCVLQTTLWRWIHDPRTRDQYFLKLLYTSLKALDVIGDILKIIVCMKTYSVTSNGELLIYYIVKIGPLWSNLVFKRRQAWSLLLCIWKHTHLCKKFFFFPCFLATSIFTDK